jgi:hypothetical protein
VQLLQMQQAQQQQHQRKGRLNRAHTSAQEAMALHEHSRRLFPAAGGRPGRGLKRSMSEGVPARENAPADEAAFWGAVARDQRAAHPHHQPPPHEPATATPGEDAGPDDGREDADEHREHDGTATPPQPVMHWTSNERRRREYAAIDRRSRGLRGLWNRLLPRFARSATKSRFYDEDRDGSDAGSVRRHRLAGL